MKKTKLFGLTALLLSLGLAGCNGSGEDEKELTWQQDKTYHWHEVEGEGGEKEIQDKVKHDYVEDTSKAVAAKCEEKGKKVEICSVCGYEQESEVKASGHTYVEDVAAGTSSTCSTAGKKVYKCSACQDTKEEALPTSDHTWNEYGADVVAANNTTYKKRSCKNCTAVDISMSALAWTKIEGSNKDTTGATLKLSSNGNYTEYKFNLGGAFNGKIYVYGWVDRYGGSDNNETKGFFTCKSSSNEAVGNVGVSVNGGANITITNKKTYAENGMGASGVKLTDAGVASDSGYERSTPALCELGAIQIAAGEATLKYSRIDSYNLNITEIHLIGTIA